jgi:hexosaminidase
MSFCGHGPSEPLDVTLDAVYDFVHSLYNELTTLFPDEWIHIGGDEVNLDCWKSSQSVQEWMRKHNVTREVDLLHMFSEKVLAHVTDKLHKRPIVWQELFDLGVELPKNAIIDVWKEWDLSARVNATMQGYKVLFSACWYLDHLNEDWYSFYKCDPRGFNGTTAQKRLVIGGHASMWGERVDATNFLPRVWPRTCKFILIAGPV